MSFNRQDPSSLELYSSAVTMSDMEIFIFPDLLFSMVLANIMSPNLWEWKKKSWFQKNEKLTPYRKILRLKQFIIDNFTFNLDLDTWGLTTKSRELARFDGFVDHEALRQSNALFGYEGDKYYFDINIRKHFGLDKYTDEIIPYWKTETIEAMEAFVHKEGYPSGAGECVSLAALYASALHLIAEVPLDDIFLLATPLHSQNFIDINGGLLTNNRRIVTKNMWFNGTELSSKARRALENEIVTIVAHHTGHIHTLYNRATISPSAFERMSGKLKDFLKTEVTFEILACFLRQNAQLQKCFQMVHKCCGKPMYIESEKLFHYEHSSKNRFGDQTTDALFHDIDVDEFYPDPLPHRIVINELEVFFKGKTISTDCDCTEQKLKEGLGHTCFNVEEVVKDLLLFAHTEPRLPSFSGKTLQPAGPIELSGLSSPEEVIGYLESIRHKNPVADLAFMAGRDMKRAPWKPFFKAAFERNPVSLMGTKELSIDQVAKKLQSFPDESIYGPTRMGQPDEVWNFARGDGLEKAIFLLNVIKNNTPQDHVGLDGDKGSVKVTHNKNEYIFSTSKEVPMPQNDDWQ